MEIKTDKNIINQIDRMIEHNMTILDDLYGEFLVKEDGIHFMEDKKSVYAKATGWVDALMWCMGAIKHGSSVSDKPLTKQGDADNE
jgi:hypothetical protein